jgi:hypothetical protein
MYAVLLFSNSLKKIKLDRNMSQFCRTVCQKCNFHISAFVGIYCVNYSTAVAVAAPTVTRKADQHRYVRLP